MGRGGGLGEAVALADGDAEGVEELGDVLRERRRPGDEELEPPAEERAHLLEHEPVRDDALRLEDRAGPSPRADEPRVFEPDAERPAEDRPLHRAALARALEHLRVDLLVDAREGALEGGARRPEVLDDLVDAPVHRSRETHAELRRTDHLPEHVGER